MIIVLIAFTLSATVAIGILLAFVLLFGWLGFWIWLGVMILSFLIAWRAMAHAIRVPEELR